MEDLTKEQIRNKVVEIATQLNEDVTLEEPIMNQLDSLDIVELVMELEKEWNIAISDSEADNVQKLEDFVDIIYDKTHKRI